MISDAVPISVLNMFRMSKNWMYKVKITFQNALLLTYTD
jgi:hypothetical protein